MALRVRPVRATSSERERGPLAWSSRTMALRFARRTVSLRCPIASRPRRSPVLCSSLSNVVTDWYTRPTGVKHRGRIRHPARPRTVSSWSGWPSLGDPWGSRLRGAPPWNSLAGKVALVTGASRGIGAAIARALAGRGRPARPRLAMRRRPGDRRCRRPAMRRARPDRPGRRSWPRPSHASAGSTSSSSTPASAPTGHSSTSRPRTSRR